MEGRDFSSIPLSLLLRRAGEPTNYKILKSLGHMNASPSELSEQLKIPATNIRSQLSKLRQLGFVEYNPEGTRHIYYLLDPMPTLKHELITELIKIDETDPDHEPFENPLPPLSQKDQKRIQKSQRERFYRKLELLASHLGHPGLTSSGKNKSFLEDRIQSLEEEIHQIRSQR